MSDNNKPMKAFCYYCDKILNEDKGELEGGCLDCYGSAQYDRINDRDARIKKLKSQGALAIEAGAVLRCRNDNLKEENQKLKDLVKTI